MFSKGFAIFFCLFCKIGAFQNGYNRQSMMRIMRSSLNQYSNDQENMPLNNLKLKLLQLAASTSRGTTASPEQRDSAMDIITELEAMNPAFDIDFSMDGCWTLVYSDTELFMSSPFFMAVRELIGADNERAQQTIRLHREATRTGEIGKVIQQIDGDIIESRVDLRVGIIPGPPFSISGEVLTRGKLSFPDKFTMNITPLDTTVKKSNLISMLDRIAIPLNTFYDKILQKDVTSKLVTYYLDDNMRITRNRDDNVFVYCR
eukprot:gene5887-11889_t